MIVTSGPLQRADYVARSAEADPTSGRSGDLGAAGPAVGAVDCPYDPSRFCKDSFRSDGHALALCQRRNAVLSGPGGRRGRLDQIHASRRAVPGEVRISSQAEEIHFLAEVCGEIQPGL